MLAIEQQAHAGLVIDAGFEKPLRSIEERFTARRIGLRGVDILTIFDQGFEPGRNFQGVELDWWEFPSIRFTGGLLVGGLSTSTGKIGGVIAADQDQPR